MVLKESNLKGTARHFSINRPATITILHWSLRKSAKFSLMVYKIFSFMQRSNIRGMDS